MSEPASAKAPEGEANAGFNAALQRPVTGLEPHFLRSLPIDNVVGAVVALTSEVYLLRERLQTLEAELALRKVLPEGAVEHHVDTGAEREARATDLAAYTHRVLSELARSREPVSRIDPQVERYLEARSQPQK